MIDSKGKNKNDYKIIISELGVNPFHVINIVFALVCVIPLLAICYIVIGKRFMYDIFIGVDGVQMSIAILIALAGLFYAYNLVRNLTEKLLIYAEERRLANSEKEEFMMAVSRDLRTPVEVIKFEMGNIRAGMDGIVGGIIADTVNKCLGATNKLADLIRNITDFPNVGFVRTNVRRTFIDFKNIVKTELGSVERLAKDSNLNLRSRFVTENADLWGDEQKLSRMTTDLIYNAIRSAPQGGAINVSVSSDDDTVRLAVENIGPELLSKETGVISKKSGDLAGDLSVARDIVELHNGHISVNNVSDRELEFNIVLPRDLRTLKGMTGLGRDKRDRATDIEKENINMWLTLNDTLRDIVSKSKTAK